MNRFFPRIFISVWAILILSGTITLLTGKLMPLPDEPSKAGRYHEQLVELVARDLRHQWATMDPDPTTTDLNAQLLDFDSLMQVYVVGPNGRDLLGRDLPTPVRRYLEQPTRNIQRRRATTHLSVQTEGLRGYTVIGYQSGYLLGRALMRPGARAILFLVGLLVSAVISWILARFIALPIRRLRQAGQQVAAGDLDVRVAHTVGNRTDDIANLAHDFDVMTTRVQSLIQSHQRLLRDVSHEMRSPLARLQALLSLARQKQTGDGVQLARMEQEVERLNHLIGEILSYARLETQSHISRHPTDMVDLLQNLVDDCDLECRTTNKQLELDLPDHCTMNLDSALIASALENIIRNAVKFTAVGTTINISLQCEEDTVLIRVADRGPGVPDEALQAIFKPFFRIGEGHSTQSGSGGIGLAIADRSIRLHNGTIQARNRPDGGLQVDIRIPT